MFEAGQWAAGNASVFFKTGSKAINAYVGSFSAQNGALDIVHAIAIEDYTCSDYTCFCLDTVAAVCNGVGAIASFPPLGTSSLIVNSLGE